MDNGRSCQCHLGKVLLGPVRHILVHAGAGRHSIKNEKSYKELMHQACLAAFEPGLLLQESLSHALSLLERHPIANAGPIGGNLNLNGHVTLDAGVMDGRGSFGAIGGVPGIQVSKDDHHVLYEPHQVALALLNQEKSGEGPLGRIPPMLLCGSEAFEYAQSLGLVDVTKSDPIPPNVRERYKRHCSWLQEENEKNKKQKLIHNQDDVLQDTVGVVVVDDHGHVLSAVSSAGMSLKTPGRIGEAAIFGAGVWAQNQSRSCPAFGTSVSGQGEQIIRTGIARKAFERLGKDDVDVPQEMQALLVQDFLKSPLLCGYQDHDVGLILYRSDCEKRNPGELWFGHTTPSFAVVCFLHFLTI